jgi:integrase
MSRRRADGEGSIWKRADGRWEGRLSLGVGPDGRRLRHTEYGKTRNEVVDKLRKARNRVAEGQPPADDRSTVAKYLRWWAEHVLPGTVRETTAYGYRRIIESTLVPRLGAHRLGSLSPAHVHAMLRDMEAEGKAPASRRNARVVLGRALAHAERWGMVPRNVASLTDAPRGPAAKTDDALDLDGVTRLIAAAEGDRLEALWVVAAMVGLRKGEALALTWDDVDLDAARLRVRGSLRRLPGNGLVVNEPKSERGARVVALPPVCLDALRRRQETQRLERIAAGPRWSDTGYIFTTEIGTPIDPDNLQRAWRKFTDKAGLGRLRFHALRHTAATVALAEGVPLEVISRQLGHAGLAITADVYAHVGDDAQRDAADAMQSAVDARRAGD